MNLKNMKIGSSVIAPMLPTDDDYAINYGPDGVASEENKEKNDKALKDMKIGASTIG